MTGFVHATPSAASRAGRWLLTALAVLALAWVVLRMHLAGQPMWAVGVGSLGAWAIWVYASERVMAWKYLFPGVAGMLVFVAFPLVYTMQIGFTNYSSSNLLTEERARAYLLDQTQSDEAGDLAFTVQRSAGGVQIVLASVEGAQAQRWVSPVLDPAAPAPAQPIAVQAAADPGQPELSLRELIALRPLLMPLQLKLPDGRVLRYVGLRNFGALQSLWVGAADGSLTNQISGERFHPNRETGFFENARGEHVQPGFRVNIGFGNYARMIFDAEFRGPFLAIFVWTFTFAALTVVFSTALGMTLAVVLNWEALKYRTLYRTLLFLPYAVPGFISILVFKGLFNQNFGEINAILDAVFGIRPAWFADPLLAKTMLLIVNTWLGYPYIMVLCTGLIKSIPADLYEASALAGAKPLTNFFRITAPLIVRPLTPLLISAFAFNFNNFVLISLLTDGRPDFLDTKLPAGTTDILVSYTYRIAFTDAGQNFGLAAAISTLIFLLVALMSWAQLKMTRQGEKR